eukprot:766522-Hanusia_phi.AAC.7
MRDRFLTGEAATTGLSLCMVDPVWKGGSTRDASGISVSTRSQGSSPRKLQRSCLFHLVTLATPADSLCVRRSAGSQNAKLVRGGADWDEPFEQTASRRKLFWQHPQSSISAYLGASGREANVRAGCLDRSVVGSSARERTCSPPSLPHFSSALFEHPRGHQAGRPAAGRRSDCASQFPPWEEKLMYDDIAKYRTVLLREVVMCSLCRTGCWPRDSHSVEYLLQSCAGFKWDECKVSMGCIGKSISRAANKRPCLMSVILYISLFQGRSTRLSALAH